MVSVYSLLNSLMAYGKFISKERKLEEVKFWHKTVFLKLHSSFVARYETTVGAYYELVDQFCETKRNIFK